MARHKGNNGVVKLGASVLGEVVDWDIDESAENVDHSALNDDWDTGEVGSKSWSGNLTLRFNDSDTAQAAIRAGSNLVLSLYTDGDASGKQFFSGSADVLTVGVGVSRNTSVDKKMSFTGRGVLASANVA